MEKLLQNERKVLKTLQGLDTELCSRDLAELSEIHPNSIGRYLKKLTEKGLIETFSKQVHNRRFNMIKISKKGKTIEINEIKVVKESKPKVEPKTSLIVTSSKNVLNIALKSELKSELRTMILNLVVRKIDYKRFKFNTAAEYRNKIIELIEVL